VLLSSGIDFQIEPDTQHDHRHQEGAKAELEPAAFRCSDHGGSVYRGGRVPGNGIAVRLAAVQAIALDALRLLQLQEFSAFVVHGDFAISLGQIGTGKRSQWRKDSSHAAIKTDLGI
jgi:hypothetical protein